MSDALRGSAAIDPSLRDLSPNMVAWLNGGPFLDDTGGFSTEDTDPSGFHRIPHRQLPNRIQEWLLRFPSAPIYGSNRVKDVAYPRDLTVPAFHSYRVLTSKDFTPTTPIQRVFILHHGLNETENPSFYYQFAEDLLEQRPGSACVLRPFPGHLTRHPHSSPFTPTPLDQYLADPGELFRQFLRYMVETRWFLSILAPVHSYMVAGGATLLGGDPSIRVAADRPRRVTSELIAEWKSCAQASRRLFEKDISPEPPDFESEVDRSLDQLRWLLGLTAITVNPDLGKIRSQLAASRPRVHVIGYSLGGFVAQSSFFSWPFLIGGCATLLAGGALREITPTAFADPEEWQSVIRGLRYEFSNTTIFDPHNRLQVQASKSARSRTSVFGIDTPLFEYFLRVFHEVFEGEFRNAYRSRVAEFNPRLFFVVGGSDQIVHAKTVFDAAPEGEGINLLQIARLTHFLGGKPQEGEEPQRAFWIPKVAGLVSDFLREADDLRRQSVASTWLPKDFTYADTPALERADPVAWTHSAKLDTPAFEQVLDQLTLRIDEMEGLLLIAQNATPSFLLSDADKLDYVGSLVHSDEYIHRYFLALKGRASVLCDSPRVVTVTGRPRPPSDTAERQPSKSETARGLLYRRPAKATFQPASRQRCLAFDELRSDPDGASPVVRQAVAFARSVGIKQVAPVTILPDAWIWVKTPWAQDVVSRNHRPDVLARSVVRSWTGHLASTMSVGDELERAVRDHELVVVRVSKSEYNPRFRGQLLVEAKELRLMVAHMLLILAAASPPGAVRRQRRAAPKAKQ